jgi:HEAT repeat protein
MATKDKTINTTPRNNPRLPRGVVRRSRSRTPAARARAAEESRKDLSLAAERLLIGLLHDPHHEPRLAAAKALFGRKSLRARISLSEALLHDPMDLVRIAAVEGLGSSGMASSLEVLECALREDDDLLVRSQAAESIAAIGGKRAQSAIQNAIRSEKSERVRVSLYLALTRLGFKEPFARLGRLLDSEDYWVRCASAAALAECALSFRRAEAIHLLRRRLARESTRSVRSRIIDCLQDLDASAE